jgi:molybdopterin converting factor small subunit
VRVTVKLFASLGRHLPRGAVQNAAEIEVPDGASPRDIIALLAVPPEHCHLVLRNGRHLDEQGRGAALSEGDTLAIWPPVAGG